MDREHAAPSNVRVVSHDEARLLARAHLGIRASREPEYLAVLVRRIAEILGAKVAAATRRGAAWSLSAESTPEPPVFLPSLAEPVLQHLVDDPDLAGTVTWAHGDVVWTLVGGRGLVPPPMVLAIRGDWTLSATVLQAAAQSAALGLAVLRITARAQHRVTSHRMSRLLANASGMPAVAKIIIDHMARAVRARMGVLAQPDATGRRLVIAATYGYTLALVEHLRIDAGVGVLGRVFETGRALHVSGGAAAMGRRRPRYRTDSFVAVPIMGAGNVIGVVCVTDRVDDQPFTRDDLSALRALAAPAALAIERERASASAEAYAHAAAIDPVSGAFNRRYFHVRLEEELQRSRRHDIPVALLMIDIDDFKVINDAFGHLAGDRIIGDVAEILRRVVRVFDVCARFGGEEFAIIMPGSGADNAERVAERIRQRIESYRPEEAALAALHITVSIGLATSSQTTEGRELIERADRALYAAKRTGKNRVLALGPDDVFEPRNGNDGNA